MANNTHCSSPPVVSEADDPPAKKALSDKLNAFLEDCEQLACCPEVYAQIHQVANDPHTSLLEMGEVISRDPDISSRLLRLANSAFYQFPRQIDQVGKAITLVGLEPLRNLITATIILNRFFSVETTTIDMRSFWQHSIGVAMISQGIANWLRESNIERYYLGGLFHDIGRLVMLLKKPQEMQQLILQNKREKGRFLFQLEQDYFGFTHAQLGGKLLQNWQLPAKLYMGIAYHHNPMDAPQQHASYAAILNLADNEARRLNMGRSGEHQNDINTIPSPLVAISEQALLNLRNQTRRYYHQVVETFFAH